MADVTYGSVTVASPSGYLNFVGPGAVLAQGYGLYRTNANQLQFQGGPEAQGLTGGYAFANASGSTHLVTISNLGNVVLGTGATEAKLETVGTIRVSGYSNITLGEGVELAYQGGQGYLSAYRRTGRPRSATSR